MVELELSSIVLDPELQPRLAMDRPTIAEYAEDMKAGATFPPITVFDDGAQKWLADGWHRYHAAREAGLGKIDADLKQGSQRDALLFSISANAKHGLRRSREDKRRAVLALLSDPEWAVLSDRELAKLAGVSHPTIAKYRAETTLPGVVNLPLDEFEPWEDGLFYFSEFFGRGSSEFYKYIYEFLPVEAPTFSKIVKCVGDEMGKVTNLLIESGLEGMWWEDRHPKLTAFTEEDHLGDQYILELTPHPEEYCFWVEIFRINERDGTGEATAVKRAMQLDRVSFNMEYSRERGIGSIRLSDFSMWCAEDCEPKYIPPYRDDYEGMFNDWDREMQDRLEDERRRSK